MSRPIALLEKRGDVANRVHLERGGHEELLVETLDVQYGSPTPVFLRNDEDVRIVAARRSYFLDSALRQKRLHLLVYDPGLNRFA